MGEQKSIFQKIIDREIPADIVYEDERCLAFRDIDPQAPVHVLLIPKQEVTNVASLTAADQDLAGHLLLTVGHIARQLGVDKTGYRIVANCGPHGGQSVDHLHFHILAGRQLVWPPG